MAFSLVVFVDNGYLAIGVPSLVFALYDAARLHGIATRRVGTRWCDILFLSK
ncbi:MAG: hypothetical protein Q7U23_08045 [Methylococcales bacterium]|nr:hypothetical protein [Methylococcales bacterium]